MSLLVCAMILQLRDLDALSLWSNSDGERCVFLIDISIASASINSLITSATSDKTVSAASLLECKMLRAACWMNGQQSECEKWERALPSRIVRISGVTRKVKERERERDADGAAKEKRLHRDEFSLFLTPSEGCCCFIAAHTAFIQMCTLAYAV